jgi:predicted membrane channel-forming protein YqfA (hemolysin III family)
MYEHPEILSVLAGAVAGLVMGAALVHSAVFRSLLLVSVALVIGFVLYTQGVAGFKQTIVGLVEEIRTADRFFAIAMVIGAFGGLNTAQMTASSRG